MHAFWKDADRIIRTKRKEILRTILRNSIEKCKKKISALPSKAQDNDTPQTRSNHWCGYVIAAKNRLQASPQTEMKVLWQTFAEEHPLLVSARLHRQQRMRACRRGLRTLKIVFCPPPPPPLFKLTKCLTKHSGFKKYLLITKLWCGKTKVNNCNLGICWHKNSTHSVWQIFTRCSH